MEYKKHFKLYKSGKQWCVAAIATLAVTTGLMVSNGNAHADTTPVQQPGTTQLSTNQNGTMGQTNTNVNLSVTPKVDNGNYGYLDSATVNNNNLNVSGWQATNQATGKNYRYVVAYDQTTHTELGRSQITTNVARPDVARAYPYVRNAGQSGYNTTIQNINWNRVGSVNDQIQIVSRYSNAANGEGQHVDNWSQSTVQLDKSNNAWLDNFNVNNNQLQVSGWHATNQSLGRNNHFIILYDQTAGREIARKQVNGVIRYDVARVYPQVINAQNSGFNTTFLLDNVDLSHTLRIISRYSNQNNGEGSYVDYWFAPKKMVAGDLADPGYLDKFDISQSGKVTVAGWHATNLARLEANHYLILFDQTTNSQVASVKLGGYVARPDVARVYPDIFDAATSGFNYTFNGVTLTPGHQYAVVSRYSTSPNGNGNDGAKTDYWFGGNTLNQARYNIDSLTPTNNGFHITGWVASDYAINRNNVYILLLQDGKQVAWTKVTLTDRPDVAKVYPNLYNSEKSGFSADLNINRSQLNGQLTFLFRFSGSNDPNKDYTDQVTITKYDKNGHQVQQVRSVVHSTIGSPIYTVDVFSGSSDSIISDPHAQGVIIKATQGTYYVNPRCNHQYALAKSEGKLLGLYHYAGGGNPVAEADFFVNSIRNYIRTGVLVLDWESAQNASWGSTTWARQFVNEVHRQTGVWPMIYCQESALWQVANCANDCALWVAKYPSMNWHSWTLPNMSVSSGAFGQLTGWQYTGDDRDRSIFYLNGDQWNKIANPTT